METNGNENGPKTRGLDLVLWGATGFTGRIAARYLASNYAETSLRLAFGGRSAERLEQLKEEVVGDVPEASGIEIVAGDSMDRAFLDAMVSRTKVVCTTVGPYARYGAGLVAACAAAGTDYCDLAAEVPFIRDMIDQHDGRARDTEARIVHACGFDSIPSDLGTLLLQETAIERFGRPCQTVKMYLGDYSGGLSGGTLASALNLAESVGRQPNLRPLMRDPYALNPEGMRSGPDDLGQTGVLFDRATGQWTAPFVMEQANARIVRRTNALLGWRYGRDFRYSETMATGSGVAGWSKASAIAGMLGVFGATMKSGALREALAKYVLPSPGEGPSEEKRESGYFRMLLAGSTEDGDEIQVRVEADGDPGYQETAKMLIESGLCLAANGVDTAGGSHTPATAMGLKLIERLREKGMRFEVE